MEILSEDQRELITRIPLIKNLLSVYEGIDEVNVFDLKHVDQDMLQLYLKLHSKSEVSNIDDDTILRYINFIEFAGLGEEEYKVICKYINKYNFLYLVTKDIFSNEFVRESLIPLLHYDVINYCFELETNTKYDDTLWFEKWIINNYKWLANNTTILDRYNVFEYDRVYYHKINGIIYSNIDDMENDVLNIQFVHSIVKRNMEIIKFLVMKGADVRYCNDKGLRTASMSGDVEIVKYLHENGADIHAEREESLILSSIHSRVEVFKYLTEKGADMTAQSSFAIICSNDLEIIKHIVKMGGDIHAREDELLMRMVDCGYMVIVKYLVEEQGADVGANDNNALLLAVKNQNMEMLEYLVERGVDVKARNNEALMRCMKIGNVEMFDYLTRKGANIKNRDDEAIEKLEVHCHFMGYKVISEYLRKRTSDPNFKSTPGINKKRLIISRRLTAKSV